MAELSQIFNGMEKGPEKIQANFDAINKELGITKGDSITITSFSGGVTGSLRLDKLTTTAKTIYVMNGVLMFPAGFKAQAICTFPTGFETYSYAPVYWVQSNNNDVSLGTALGAVIGKTDRTLTIIYKNGSSLAPIQVHAVWSI
jgi:hypothetical protein